MVAAPREAIGEAGVDLEECLVFGVGCAAFDDETLSAEGDAEAIEVVRSFAWWVALGIANLINILDSELVVIGGGLVDSGDVLLDPVRAAYEELVMGADHRDPVPIVGAALGSRAGAWGAALLAMARLDV